MAIDQQLFRDIMAGFPSGVTIVSALGEGGEPNGMTVSAFCSVSLDPPLVLVSIEHTATTLPAILTSGGFTVNFLAVGQDELSDHFATKAPDKFSGINWSKPRTPRGGPILDGAVTAYIECDVQQAVEAGDHFLFVGRVTDGWLGPDDQPLMHWKRRYLTLSG
jgi:flavin reductase (DIM6/NTAB) family NADH-FMN oxidoreductase RutF